MAKRKTDTEYTDAKGNLHRVFADGRSEIYIGGFDKSARYVEVTDEGDRAVNRKRFLLQREETLVDMLTTRDDPEIATPGLDFDDREIDEDE